MPILDLGKVIGPQGPQGPPGVSPTVQIDKTASGTKVTITGAGGAQSFEVLDGDTIAVGSNPNLLDNWYFADPINQRGEKEYTKLGYAIDRWTQTNGTVTSVQDEYISISNGENATAVFAQYIEAPYFLRGNTVTLSILYRTSFNTFKIEAGITTSSVTYPAVVLTPSDNWKVASFTLNVPQETTKIRFGVATTANSKPGTIDIKAMKLELGPVQTLAHKEGDTWVLNDPPPNKAVELAKCQRYQYVIDSKNNNYLPISYGYASSATTVVSAIDIPVPLRVTPSISYSGNMALTCIDTAQSDIPISSIAVSENNDYKTSITTVITAEGITPYAKYRLRSNKDRTVKIIFDANL